MSQTTKPAVKTTIAHIPGVFSLIALISEAFPSPLSTLAGAFCKTLRPLSRSVPDNPLTEHGGHLNRGAIISQHFDPQTYCIAIIIAFNRHHVDHHAAVV